MDIDYFLESMKRNQQKREQAIYVLEATIPFMESLLEFERRLKDGRI